MATTAAQLQVAVSVQGMQTAKSDLSTLSSETDKTATGLKKVGTEAKGAGDSAGEASGGLKGFLANMLGIAGGVTAAELARKGLEILGDQVKDTIKAGEEFQQTQAQTIAVLKSTHDASGESAQGIDDLAESLAKVTPFSAETTQSAENMLLTFTNIGKNVFPQATKTALDMAQALGGDAKQQALQLGIALNNPEQGIGRLTRVGVTFTDSQKKLIKSLQDSGNMAGAQKVVLQELQKEFGGSAKAAGQTFAGSLQIAQNQMEIAREKIGSALLPALAGLAQGVAPLISSFADKLPDAIDFVTAHFDTLKPVLVGLGIALAVAVVPALVALVAPMAAAALSAVALAAPFILLGLAIAGIILYFQHLMATSAPFKAAVTELQAVLRQLAQVVEQHLMAGLQKLLPYVQQAAQWLGGQLQAAAKNIFPVIMQAVAAVTQFAAQLETKLGPAIDNVFSFIQAALVILQGIWTAVWPSLQTVLQGVWDVIQGVVKVAWALISGIITVGLDILGGNWKAAWNDLKSTLGSVWAGIQQIIQGAVEIVKGDISGFISGVIALFQGLWDKLVGHSIIPDMVTGIISWFLKLPGEALNAVVSLDVKLMTFFEGLAAKALTWGVDMVKSLAQGIMSAIGNVTNAAANIASAITSHLHFSKPDVGPLADVDTWMPDFGKLLASGLDAQVAGVGAAANRVAGAVAGGLSPGAASGLLAPSASALLSQQLASAGASALTTGSGQQAIIVLDGLKVGTALLPHLGTAARIATGIRSY